MKNSGTGRPAEGALSGIESNRQAIDAALHIQVRWPIQASMQTRGIVGDIKYKDGRLNSFYDMMYVVVEDEAFEATW